MNVPQVDMIRFRAMWYSVCFASVVWYSYWILYDLFVWNKAFMQVNPVNYFGLTAAVGLILFEARIRTPRRFERPKMEQQVIALPLRIGACPYHIDYFDQPNRTSDIPKKCMKCSNIIDCACRSSRKADSERNAPN
jgi:hypothetical protein